jgi:hypothetical protein
VDAVADFNEPRKRQQKDGKEDGAYVSKREAVFCVVFAVFGCGEVVVDLAMPGTRKGTAVRKPRLERRCRRPICLESKE